MACRFCSSTCSGACVRSLSVYEASATLLHAAIAFGGEGEPLVSYEGAWKQIKLFSRSEQIAWTPVAIRSTEEWRKYFVDRLVGFGRGASVNGTLFAVIVD